MQNILSPLLHAIEAGESLALATLIDTKGSTPQVTGASALFSTEGLLAGTLGGGLLEAQGQQRALQALASGHSVLFACDLMADVTDADGAICGGSARILIDVHPLQHTDAFRAMSDALENGFSGALLTLVVRKSGDGVLIERRWVSAEELASAGQEELASAGQAEWYAGHIAAIAEAFADHRPTSLAVPMGFDAAAEEQVLFVQPAYPLPQLIITGAGHVGRALAHYARRLDFRVTVIDDRAELANSGNIPEADFFIVDDIGSALAGLTIHEDTYIVIVNRGHRGDAEALRECIASEAAYVGMIGSKRKIAQMRQKFIDEGWATAKQFDRVHAPIGLDIDAKTVEEIAVSIAAELVSERRRRLRGEQGP